MEKKSFRFRVGCNLNSLEVDVMPITGKEFREYRNCDHYFTIHTTCLGMSISFAVPWCYNGLSLFDIHTAFATWASNHFRPSASPVGTCGNEEGEDK